ncbi:unnamed protein product [Arctia plantaginis]|uniref:Uncharacterized protein n=1 Tax=Arctia plantaginis TaxID=874455 RepID=A0A8S1AV75_ARCPL|nr:unnamed protein product [Arctia plantaginis]
MAAKFVVLAAFVAVAHCSVVPVARVDADYTSFAYDVADPNTAAPAVYAASAPLIAARTISGPVAYTSAVPSVRAFGGPVAYNAPTVFAGHGVVAARAYAPAYYANSPLAYSAYSAPLSYW